MWRSPVAQGVWDAKVAGSNPATPTSNSVFLFSFLVCYPTMSFVIALGAFLGFIAPQNPVLVLSVLAAVLFAKGVFDVRYSHRQLFNRPSPFLHYCKNLMERDEEITGAAFSYMLQLVAFGMLAGGGMYALVRFLRSGL